MRRHQQHAVILLLHTLIVANAFLIQTHPWSQSNLPLPPSSSIPSSCTSTTLHEAALPFAGSGPRQVDMNVYNLPLEIIAEQWTANLIAKTVDDDGGIFLGTKNDREYFPDVLTVTVPRDPSNSNGLGIMLQEIAGGREDGLGITVVSGLVEGGWMDSHCEDMDIMPGDSITSITVVKTSTTQTNAGGGGGLTEQAETVSATTECLGYDQTVDAIVNLPSCVEEGESLVLTLKRIRRKPVIKVHLKYPPSQKKADDTIELFAGENLRLGMLVRGVKLNDPLAKRFDTKSEGNCGAGGLCRTCSVSVLRGGDLLNPQKVAEKQMLGDNPRWRLGCKAFVGYGMKEGEISVQVNPNQWGS